MKALVASSVIAIAVLFAPFSSPRAEEPIKPTASIQIGALGAYGFDLTKLFPGGTRNPNDGELVMGNGRHRVEHDGVTFLFASAEGAEKFRGTPDYYLPGGGGYCLLGLHRRATGAPHEGDMPPPGDPAARTFGDGRWYFHGGLGAEKIFEENPQTIDKRTREAEAYYKKRFGGTGAGMAVPKPEKAS